MRKVLRISLKLNFYPNTLGWYGLKKVLFGQLLPEGTNTNSVRALISSP